MKKVMVILLLAVVTSGSAFAQKGMQGVGVNAAMNAHVGSGASTSLGPSVKYQYNISNFIRIEPSFSYYFPFCKITRNYFNFAHCKQFLFIKDDKKSFGAAN